MAEHQLPKLNTGVRFPSSALGRSGGKSQPLQLAPPIELDRRDPVPDVFTTVGDRRTEFVVYGLLPG